MEFLQGLSRLSDTVQTTLQAGHRKDVKVSGRQTEKPRAAIVPEDSRERRRATNEEGFPAWLMTTETREEA